jgi:hypothetical protein
MRRDEKSFEDDDQVIRGDVAPDRTFVWVRTT